MMSIQLLTVLSKLQGRVEVGTGPPGSLGPSPTRCVLVQPSALLMSVPLYEASAEL